LMLRVIDENLKTESRTGLLQNEPVQVDVVRSPRIQIGTAR